MKTSSTIIKSFLIASLSLSGFLSGCSIDSLSSLNLSNFKKPEVSQKDNSISIDTKKTEENEIKFNSSVNETPSPLESESKTKLLNNPVKLSAITDFLSETEKTKIIPPEGKTELTAELDEVRNLPVFLELKNKEEFPKTLTFNEIVTLKELVKKIGFKGSFKISQLPGNSYAFNILSAEGKNLLAFKIENLLFSLPSSLLNKNFSFSESSVLFVSHNDQLIGEDEDGQCWSRKGGVGYLLSNSTTKAECRELGGKSFCYVGGGCEDL